MRKSLFGDEDNPGLLTRFINATGELEQASDATKRIVGPALDEQRNLLQRIIKAINELTPPVFEQSVLIDVCPGAPTENREGLQHGCDTVRQCGSTAISDQTRANFQLITQKGDNSTG